MAYEHVIHAHVYIFHLYKLLYELVDVQPIMEFHRIQY